MFWDFGKVSFAYKYPSDGQIFGAEKLGKTAKLLPFFIRKICSLGREKERRKKFENPREIRLGGVRIFKLGTKRKLRKKWRPIFLVVAECGKEEKEEKILVEKLVSGQE